MSKPLPSEHAEQVAVIQWCDAQTSGPWSDARYIFAVPNGGSRNIIEATRMKAAGVRAGMTDLILPIPKMNSGRDLSFCGALFIEMKRREGFKVPVEQKKWHDFLKSRGYRVEVCRGYDDAVKAIKEHLK